MSGNLRLPQNKSDHHCGKGSVGSRRNVVEDAHPSRIHARRFKKNQPELINQLSHKRRAESPLEVIFFVAL